MTTPNNSNPPPGLHPPGLFSEAFIVSPFPMLAQMRAKGPVVSVPAPYNPDAPSIWMVTRLEEAVQVLKNQVFTVDAASIDYGADEAPRNRAGGPGGILGESMIFVDEPDHRRLRSLVSKAFTPKFVQGLRPAIQQIADDLIDRVQAQGHMDLVSDYAFPLPITVISQMLGVPTDRQALIREWSELFSGGGAARQGDAYRFALSQEFADYLVQLIAEKRAHPQDDLISQLIHIEEEGDRLTEGELLSMIALLIFAGHETTSNLIGLGMLTLFDHPDQFQRLKNDLALVPSAVEEFLRFNGPVLTPAPRFAAAEVTLAGQQIRKGDMVLVVLGSANHDETQFTQPEDLDIARSLNRHVAFGQGIHVCLGAPLARLEGDVAFTTLLRRLPDIHLAVPRGDFAWRGNVTLRGVRSLPVAF